MYLFVNFIFNFFFLFKLLQLLSQKNQVSTFVIFCLNSLHIYFIVLCVYRQKSQIYVSIILLIIPYFLSTFPSNDCFQRSKIC